MKKRSQWIGITAAVLVLVLGGLWAGSLRETPDLPKSSMTMRASNYDAAGSVQLDADDVEEGIYDSGSVPGGMAVPEPMEQRKLVRTVDLTVSTQHYEETSARVKEQLTGVGGYVESLYERGEAGSRRLTLSLRVPSGQLDAFLTGLDGVGRVTSRSESTVDKTTAYQDNAARLETLYEKRNRLNTLLSKAEDVSDLIEIESAIADTQYQIDSYETRQRTIDRQVDMSQVSLTLVEERPMDTAGTDDSLVERMRAGLTVSVEWLWDFVRDVAVFVVMLLPVALPMAAVVWVIHLIRKRRKGEKK